MSKNNKNRNNRLLHPRVVTGLSSVIACLAAAIPVAAAELPVANQASILPVENLAPVADWRTRVRGDSITIANGMKFMVKDYITKTSFKNQTNLKPVFEPAFQQRFLKRPVQYTEEVQDLQDRLYVKRTMLVDAKDPCDPELAKLELGLCFKQSNKMMLPESKAHLDQVRAKIKLNIARASVAEKAQLLQYLQMDDKQLMHQLVNLESTTKIVSHESVVPYIAYEFRKVPAMGDLFELRMPISRINQLSSVIPTVSRVQFAQGAAPQPYAAPTAPAAPAFNNQSQPGMNSAMNSSLGSVSRTGSQVNQAILNQDPPAPGPYQFPNTREITGKALTGWTVGKTFGDKFEVTFAKGTWWHDRYYASFRYDITAGFGLRWPFDIKATSTIDQVYGRTNQRILPYPANEICQGGFPTNGQLAHTNAFYCAQRGRVNVTATPVDGNAAFYQATGLPSDKVFNGKEFVLEIGATCKLYASIPGPNISYNCPSSLRGINLSKDFTPQLGNNPQTLVNFTQPGRPIGLALEAGIGYAALNPGISLSGNSGTLSLGVEGYQAIPSVNRAIISATPAVFSVTENNAKGNWGVVMYEPKYEVNATLIPSLQVEVGLDLGIYEWSKKFGPYNIDALAVELGRAYFPPHAGARGEYELKNIGIRPNR